MMGLYVAEPPYFAREGKLKLPNPNKEECVDFLRSSVRHAFRDLMRSSYQLASLMDAGDLPMRPTDNADHPMGPEQVIDIANLTTQQYDKVVRKASSAMYEALCLTRVWNPVVLQATRAIGGKWGEGWIASTIRDVYAPGKAGSSVAHSMTQALVDLEKAPIWEKVGALFGEKIAKGAIGQLRSPSIKHSELNSVKMLLAKGLPPESLGMVTPNVARRFSPDTADEMERKSITMVAPVSFAKALDVELFADPMTVVRMRDSQAGLLKSKGSTRTTVQRWATRVRDEGGANPYAWLKKSVAPYKLGENFCARVFIEAFGYVPA